MPPTARSVSAPEPAPAPGDVQELTLAELQAAELDCLLRTTAVLDDLGMPYYLDYGTLLGARRHGGFIPWDDDIDITIQLSDVARLTREAPHVLPPRMRFDPTPKGHRFPKVLLEDTSVIEINPLYDDSAPNGQLWIDLFPLASLRRPFGLARVAQMASYASMIHSFSDSQWRRIRNKQPMKAAALRALSRIPEPVMYQMLRPLVERNEPAIRGRRVGHAFGLGFGPEYFPADMLFPLGTIEFEGHVFSAPRDVDGYLTRIYGDWRAIPPENERVGHFTWVARVG